MTTLVLQIGSAPIYSNALGKTLRRPQSSTCIIVAETRPCKKTPIVHRRSANYQPSLWDHHHLLSVENKYMVCKYPYIQYKFITDVGIVEYVDNFF